jgi:signal transduction histidine kinase
MGVWWLAWMHSRARDQAQAALEQTLKSLAEGERKLSGVVESTEDIVCSLDTQARLLTANAAMRRWFHQLFGREPQLGEPLLVRSFLERHPDWPESFRRALQGEQVRVEAVYPLGETSLALDFSLTAIPGVDGRPAGVTIFGRDITSRRQAEARMGELHRTLLDTSRKAGMAEIATGVLHNVGNTLNSVNVSAHLLAEQLHDSRIHGLVRATELMHSAPDLGAFLTRDERGRLLPEYLLIVSRHLAEDHSKMLSELQSLIKNVDHIKSVVNMQQEYARFTGDVEEVSLPELLDDALRLHSTSFERLGIQMHREYVQVPSLRVDRHKLLQILVNLLSNARDALLESGRPEKHLTLRVQPQPEGRLRIEVADNGVGIAPEHQQRIFTQGFTTKKNGHGFGLHASALAAREMGGSLTCTSPGRGQGAIFTIDLPLTPEQARE